MRERTGARELHDGGRAEICFARGPDGNTYIAAQRIAYPFHVTRPFYLEGDPEGMPTVYLQSVSGGIYPGEDIELRLIAGEGSAAHVTTQAATIVHGVADSREASQSILLEATKGSLVEYWPDPMVLFPHAALSNALHVRVDSGATVLICDSILDHDPTGGGRHFARLAGELRVERPDGSLVALDRYELPGAGLRVANTARGECFRAHGTIVCLDTAHPATELAAGLAHALEDVPGVYAGASALPLGAGVWSRLLASDSQGLRTGLERAWCALRRALTGRTPRARAK